MKPRIFINIHYMEIGGAERALLGLLNAIDTNKVNVDLFINQHTGEFMKLIPEKINLLPEISAYSVIEKPLATAIKKGHWGIAIARLLAKVAHKFYSSPLRHCVTPLLFFSKKQRRSCGDTTENNPFPPYSLKQGKSSDDYSIFHYVAKYTTPLLPSLKKYGEYDLAISFLTPHNIVKDKVRAKRKLAWIHTDYSTISVNVEQELPIWNSFDNIVSISSDVTKSFIKTFPTLKNKIIEIENILSPTFIRQQAKLFTPQEMQGDYIKICSIGRFCYAKNFESIPFIAQKLKEKGLKFKWYIIGFGDTAETIQKINLTNTEDCVILLGKKENPYPYIASCDLYMQPSRYEGKSVTVREAQILCKPVIITNYPTAPSQVKNGIDGIICEMDNDQIANAIYNLANDKEQQAKLTEYLSTHDFGNEIEVNKIYRLL